MPVLLLIAPGLGPLGKTDAFAQARSLALPLLMLVGGADSIARVESSREFFQRLPGPDQQLEVYDEMYHEIFADPDRKRIFDLMFPWLERHLPG